MSTKNHCAYPTYHRYRHENHMGSEFTTGTMCSPFKNRE